MDSPRSRLGGQIWCADCGRYHSVGMHIPAEKIEYKKYAENEYDKLLDNWQKQIDTLNSIKDWTAVNKDVVDAEIDILQKCHSELSSICKKI